ncbi:MAG: hypothetical protein F6K22_30430 [Okeania sp. SIO2F4]|uniref:hypothetical protein n=1 Tax=Okeania sp. SIO2F4 TaxID=2607790 RepID=UPI00142B2183|nr:hypothetical protein [Okeania sp. SIO2F4]NES06757.1 hypothetical protein [Okeania sp. SIO2F4]
MRFPWGGGTSWNWQNAINLCEGTQNASLTIRCFQREIQKRRPWSQAIQTCSK